MSTELAQDESSINSFGSDVPMGTDVIQDSLETLYSLYDYHHWIYTLMRSYVTGRVLEVGCGVGNMTQFLSLGGHTVVGIDPVARFIKRFDQRFGHMSHVSGKVAYLQDLPAPTEGKQFDTVVSCNVLEHIEDDVQAVSMMAKQLRPGGHIAIFVPAGPMALGLLDRELGHYRRYTVRSLRRVFFDAELQWVEGRYSNCLGLFGWWLNSVVLRRRRVPVKQAVLYNRLVPILSAIERMIKPPFGQSVIGIARRPMDANESQVVTDEDR